MRILSLIIFTAIPLLLQAQQLSIPYANHWQLVFNKLNQLWDWHGKYRYIKDPYSGPGVNLTGNFSSSYYESNLSRWKDQHSLDGYFFIKSPFKYHGLYVKSWLLKEDFQDLVRNTRSFNQRSNHALGFKGTYDFTPNFSLIPYLGYQRSQINSIVDWGWDMGVRGEVRNYSLGDYKTHLELSSDYDFYQHRKNSFNFINLGMKTVFSPKARDSISVGYGNENQQYFTPDAAYLVNSNLESKRLFNVLNYSLTNRSQLVLTTQLLSKNLLDDTPDDINDRDILRIENKFNYQIFSSRFLFSMGVHSFSESQDNIELATDSKLQQTGLNTYLFFDAGENDRFDLEIDFIKFQYDTPDTASNFDDRDEIRLIGFLNYSHRFNPVLRLNIEAYIYLHHKIYIYQEQSANNNWNRIYRLNAMVKYNNYGWRNTLMTQVLANYTVYDFDELFKDTRSFVFREYIISDSLEIPLFTDLIFGWYGEIELKDTGSFYKDEFSEQIQSSINIGLYEMYIRKRNVLNFDLIAGIVVYKREDWRHMTDLKRVRNNQKISPYLSIIYPLGKNVRFVSNVSVSYLKDIGRQVSTYTTGNLDLYYLF